MSIAEMTKRMNELEQPVALLSETVDYQQTVEGIRRGLESVERGEGVPAKIAFDQIRAKYKLSSKK